MKYAFALVALSAVSYAQVTTLEDSEDCGALYNKCRTAGSSEDICTAAKKQCFTCWDNDTSCRSATGADIPGCNTQVIQCVNSAFIVLSQGSSAATTSASASASSSAAASSTSVSTAGAGTTLSTVSSAATTATSAGGAQTTTGAGSQATGAATTGKGSVSSTNGTTSGIVTTSGASSNGLGFFGAIAAVAAMVPFLA